MPRRRPAPDNLKELYASHSIPELRQILSCSQRTLCRWLDEAEIKRRRTGDQRRRLDTTIHVGKLSTGETT